MDTYEEIVANIIKAHRPDIAEVLNVQSIQNLWFSHDLYPAVKAAIERLDFSDLPHAEHRFGELREYLDISTFEDAAGNKYVVTIYDSDELSQDPEVLDIWKVDAS